MFYNDKQGLSFFRLLRKILPMGLAWWGNASYSVLSQKTNSKAQQNWAFVRQKQFQRESTLWKAHRQFRLKTILWSLWLAVWTCRKLVQQQKISREGSGNPHGEGLSRRFPHPPMHSLPSLWQICPKCFPFSWNPHCNEQSENAQPYIDRPTQVWGPKSTRSDWQRWAGKPRRRNMLCGQ